MNFQVGDLVTRNSHNNDTVFKITKINDEICYLKGINIRLMADALLTDLKKYEGNDLEEEKIFLERIKPKNDLERDDYFYLPGKILHIDTEFQLTNTLANPYKIRKKAIFENCKNHQK